MSIKTIEDCIDYERDAMPIHCCYLSRASFDANKNYSIIYFTKPPDFTTTSANRPTYRYRYRDPRVHRAYFAKSLDDKVEHAYPLDDLCMSTVKIRYHRDFPKTITGEEPAVAVIDDD